MRGRAEAVFGLGSSRDPGSRHVQPDDAEPTFASIFHDHYPVLHARARRLLGTAEGADDACQETFRKALEGFAHFGSTGEYRVGAWLNTILHNVCVDVLVKANRERDLARLLLSERQEMSDAAEGARDPAAAAAVRQAVARLRPELRSALLLHEMQGLSYAEVALAEGISVDLARVRAFRARRTLRGQLAGGRTSDTVAA